MKIDIKRFKILVVCGDDEVSKKAIIERIKRHNISVSLPEEKVLIAENPENNMHPSEQTEYAEMYVRIAKEHDEKLFLTTNSFHFIKAFVFFMVKHSLDSSVRFYTVHNGEITESDNPYDVMKNLSLPSYELADMKFEFYMEMRRNHDRRRKKTC